MTHVRPKIESLPRTKQSVSVILSTMKTTKKYANYAIKTKFVENVKDPLCATNVTLTEIGKEFQLMELATVNKDFSIHRLPALSVLSPGVPSAYKKKVVSLALRKKDLIQCQMEMIHATVRLETTSTIKETNV